jgi:hypothetical protein
MYRMTWPAGGSVLPKYAVSSALVEQADASAIPAIKTLSLIRKDSVLRYDPSIA